MFVILHCKLHEYISDDNVKKLCKVSLVLLNQEKRFNISHYESATSLWVFPEVKSDDNVNEKILDFFNF